MAIQYAISDIGLTQDEAEDAVDVFGSSLEDYNTCDDCGKDKEDVMADYCDKCWQRWEKKMAKSCGLSLENWKKITA